MPRPLLVLVTALALALPATAAAADEPVRTPITGTVTTPGQASYVHVLATNLDDGHTYRHSVDGDGTYEIWDARPGRYRLVFTDEEGNFAWQYYPSGTRQAQARVVTVRPGRPTTDVDVTMRPGGSISGTVRTPDLPRGVSGAEVTVYHEDAGRWVPVPHDEATSRTRPEFILGGLPAGSYRLRYETEDGHGGTASGFHGGTDDPAAGTPIEVAVGETTAVEIVPRRGGTLEGRVVDPEGRPVAGTTVSIIRPDQDEGQHAARTTTTDADGRYSLFPVDTADYVLSLQPPEPFDPAFTRGAQHAPRLPYSLRGVPTDAARIRTTAARTTRWPDEVVRPRGGITGQVVVRRSDRIAAGVTVTASRLYRYDADGGWSIGVVAETQTDSRGRYSFPSLATGLYRVSITDPLQNVDDAEYDDFDNRSRDHRLWRYVEVGPEHLAEADVFTGVMRFGLSNERPVVGERLSTFSDQYRRYGGDAWVWRRDGEVIAGASDETYVVQPQDLGARLTVERNAPRREGGSVLRSDPTDPVTEARPELTTTSRALGHGRVEITVRARHPGVATRLIDGRVDVGRVRPGSDRLTTRTMRDGRLVLVLTGQPRGRQTFSTRFLAVPDRFDASRTSRRSQRVR